MTSPDSLSVSNWPANDLVPIDAPSRYTVAEAPFDVTATWCHTPSSSDRPAEKVRASL